jgi:hypothetical protein
MRLVLPGGAVLRKSSGEKGEREVACRPGAAVLERPWRPGLWRRLKWRLHRLLSDPERLARLKLVLEVLAVIVGLVGAILALFGILRK